MKHIFYQIVLLVITEIFLVSCYNDTANSSADGGDSVSVDASSSEVLHADGVEDLDAEAGSSCTESGEDGMPEPFVELTPFDINEKEYRFMVGDTEYVIDLSYYDSTSLSEFDALEELEHKTDKVYTEKQLVTSVEEALNYGVKIFREYLISTGENETTEWLLLGVMRDEANDAWGICFGPAPLRPGYDLRISYYSDGEMISFRPYGE